jgi:hypothetical protein
MIIANPALDSMSEFYHYEDTGCEVSSACLNCPLPKCKYDDPTWYQKNRRIARDLKILTVMRNEELTVEDTAERFGVTVRTIFRIMRRCREDSVVSVSRENIQLFAA